MKSLLVCLLLVALATAAPSGKPMFLRGHNKVVGGSDAKPGEIPFIISFQETKFGSHHHVCGGSIYTETWIISAAQCVMGENLDHPTNLRIVAGENDLSKEEGTEQIVKVIRIIRHQGYDGKSHVNDIALYQIASPLIFNEYVRSIALPKKLQQFTGSAYISGWGQLTEGGVHPDILQVVSASIISRHECVKAYGVRLRDDMICAGDDGIDSCKGDGGGPLTCTYRGYTYLCGICSWGIGCAHHKTPGLYTDVSYFIDWIEYHSGTQE